MDDRFPMVGDGVKEPLYRVVVVGPPEEGQVPPAIVFLARFSSESEARAFAHRLAAEEWGEEKADRAQYTVEVKDESPEEIFLAEEERAAPKQYAR